MATRWSRVAVVAAVVMAPATARADQEVTLQAMEITISVPEEWAHEFSGKVDAFTHAESGRWIGAFSSFDNTCATVLATLREGSDIVDDDVTPVEGWSGFDEASDDGTNGVYCRETRLGRQFRIAMLVSGPTTEVLPLVRAVSAWVDGNDATWDRFAPEDKPDGVTPPRRQRLPVTIEPSAQTIKIGERGYGGRVAVFGSRTFWERLVLGARGEVGYDSKTKLSYDAAARLEGRVVRMLSLILYFGRDQLGTDDVASVAGAWYNGAGASLAIHDGGGHALVELALLRRSGHDAELDPPDPRHPFVEIRVRSEVTWTSSSPLTGVTADYRMIGDARVVSLGFLVQL